MVETSPTRKKAKASPLTNFPLADLPQEVQGWIIELACRLPFISSSSFSSPDGSPHPGEGLPVPFAADSFDSKPTHLDIDSPTTLSLALVSRSFHSQVDQVFYSRIRITRPSALLALQRTLVSRPQLGHIIKSLWVGPDDKLAKWWPLRPGTPTHWMTTSLSWLRESNLIPKWVRRPWWHVNTFKILPDCRGKAVLCALKAAQGALNVDLNRYGLNHSGEPAGLSQWIIRVLEAQAALDLYLIEMRRLEDATDDFNSNWRSQPDAPMEVPPQCSNGSCNHYPTLDISTTDFSTRPRSRVSTSTGPQPPLVLTRGQLLQHLARPGSIHDHFDHLLLFLRSGVTGPDLKHGGRARGNSELLAAIAAEQVPDNSDKHFMSLGREVSDQFNTAQPSSATMGCLIGRVLVILKLAPRLTNLSLSGRGGGGGGGGRGCKDGMELERGRAPVWAAYHTRLDGVRLVLATAWVV